MTKIFFSPLSFVAVFWIRDPGWVKIRIRDPGSRIRDKHPGSATLEKSLNFICKILRRQLIKFPSDRYTLFVKWSLFMSNVTYATPTKAPSETKLRSMIRHSKWDCLFRREQFIFSLTTTADNLIKGGKLIWNLSVQNRYRRTWS